MFSIIGFLLNKCWIWPEANPKKKKKKRKKKKRKAPWVPPIFDNFKQIISRKFSISKKII
jgi:hypothetical protein